VMDIHAELFLRKDIRRLGIAPLTSMYWYGENERSKAVDWRPEVHDSDSLVLWTGRGERICRPLINPPAIQTNAFLDRGPKGFGLMQRDRNFDDYQDDGAFYNRRPSVWVEPVGDWGEGEVQLVELPTTDEVHDNIVAYWVRKAPARRGDTIAYDYRLYWQDHEPNRADDVGRVVATRLGRGGAPGKPEPGDASKTKFVIDFAGGALENMHRRYDVEPIITAPHARVSDAFVIKVAGTNRWRAFFDVAPLKSGPINLRCYLRLDRKTLSETWLYQWFPGM
jgi:glucans biosynthesis protein